MPNKNITLFDFQKANDDVNLKKTWLKGEEPILTVHNKVVIAGSQFVAQKVFDLDELVHLPTYNESLSLDNSSDPGAIPENTPKACLFCCGTQGCGPESSAVYPVQYTNRIKPAGDLVPFRYQLIQNDLPDDLREVYFGRKATSDRIAYYFKAFESEPKLYMQYVDSTPIDSTLYDSQNTSDAETYVEFTLRITKDDFRDYFRATSSINDAKINSISILTAWYTTSQGYKWYQNIIPLTQLNIPNESLIDLTKGIDITYHIYF